MRNNVIQLEKDMMKDRIKDIWRKVVKSRLRNNFPYWQNFFVIWLKISFLSSYKQGFLKLQSVHLTIEILVLRFDILKLSFQTIFLRICQKLIILLQSSIRSPAISILLSFHCQLQLNFYTSTFPGKYKTRQIENQFSPTGLIVMNHKITIPA